MAGEIRVISVTWDENAVRLMAETPSSPIGHALQTLAGHLVNEMKARCPVSPGGRSASGGGRWPARASGTLRNSIRQLPGEGEAVWMVGPTDQLPGGQFLGELIEKGTPPHSIDSTGPWPLRNPDTGQIFGPHVDHPGTAPHPFIAPAAEAMNGYRVEV